MNDLKLSKYMYETIASGATNQLPVSSVCNAKCVFCSNDMNPFQIYRIGFRPLDDVKKGIALLNPDADEIRLGDSLPGRISEGEALLHPDIFTIFKLIRDKIPNKVIQISTNATMLTKDFIEKLIPFKPMKFTISYHSDNPKYWCKILNLREDKFNIARNSLYHLLKNEFLIEGALVPMPNLVGYSDIANTLKILGCFTKNIMVYAPGYSGKSSEKLRKIMKVDFYELSAFLTKMRKKYKINLFLMPDLIKPLDFLPYPLMLKTSADKFLNVLWFFSEAAYERGKKILEDFNTFVPNEHHAFLARNYTYGGNIICSGLLMVSDYRIAVKKAAEEFSNKKNKINLIILSCNSFDRYGDDLQGDNYAKLIEEFKIPIWLG